MAKEEPITLLIAEDEPMLRAGLARLPWEAQGITLLAQAKNGIQAAELIEAHRVDILLTDIRMPGLSGMEVAERLRSRAPQAEILFLTGYGEFEYAQKAISLQAAQYILKPAMPDDILRAVNAARDKILARRSRADEDRQLRMELQNLSKVASAAQPAGAEEELPTEEDIQLVVNYIRAHYAEPLNLAALAEEFHFNAVYLSRLIKKKSGHTFTELLTSTRMYHAARLLRETVLKNGEICARIGMSDERYFSQVFQRTYGLSPQEYRKQHRRGNQLPRPMMEAPFEDETAPRPTAVAEDAEKLPQ